VLTVIVVVAALVGFIDADSGCFPFDFDEIEVKLEDVGDTSVYPVIMSVTAQNGGAVNLPAMQHHNRLCSAQRMDSRWSHSLNQKVLEDKGPLLWMILD
jgi:hypothetical protein